MSQATYPQLDVKIKVEPSSRDQFFSEAVVISSMNDFNSTKEIENCCLCSVGLELQQSLVEHFQTHHPNLTDGMFIDSCQCTDSFVLQSQLVNHLLSHVIKEIKQTESPAFEDNELNAPSIKSEPEEMLSDDEEETSSCWSAESPKKKRVRRTLSAVANDFSFDEETQKFSCGQCEKQYVSKAVVRQHLVNNHDDCSTTHVNKEKPRNLRVRRILTAIANDWFFNEEAQKFECNYCPKQSLNKVRIRVHLEDCHKDKIPGSVTKGKNIPMKRESRNSPSQKRKERKPHEKRPPVANDFTYDNNSNVYCCKHCDRIFSSTGGVRKHLAEKHDPFIGEELKVEHCDASYQLTNNPTKSRTESTSSKDRKRVRRQRPPVANNFSYDSGKNAYCCDHCDKNFSSSRAARKHLTDKHNPHRGLGNYETETVWLSPIEKIDKNKCKNCPREFLAREGLDNHWNAEHNPENVLKCDYCESVFCKDLTSLEKHMKFHSFKPTPGAYHCMECFKVFSTPRQYYHHMQTHREKRFACDLCGFRFQFKVPLFRHLYSHFRALNPGFNHVKVPVKRQEDLLCSQCSAMIKRHQMSRHMATHHSVSRPLKCDRPDCKYSCFEMRQLIEHKNTHSQVRPHKCEICDKGFNHLGGLRMHRLRHTDPDKFKCEICQNCFVTGESLKKHKLSKHSDDADLDPSLVPHPFACDYEGCQSTFRFSAALKRHTITVHNKKVVIMNCNVCSFVANSTRNYHQHRRRAHGIRITHTRVFPLVDTQ